MATVRYYEQGKYTDVKGPILYEEDLPSISAHSFTCTNLYLNTKMYSVNKIIKKSVGIMPTKIEIVVLVSEAYVSEELKEVLK